MKREIIPKDILLFVNEELYKYYFNKKEYQNCEEILNELYELTLNNKYSNELIKLTYLQEKYELVITKSEDLIENNANDYTQLFTIFHHRITKKHRKANTMTEYRTLIIVVMKTLNFLLITKLLNYMKNKIVKFRLASIKIN